MNGNPEKKCYSCLKPHSKLRCSRCRRVFFCDKNCQKKSWKRHSKSCIPPTPTEIIALKMAALPKMPEGLTEEDKKKWNSERLEKYVELEEEYDNLVEEHKKNKTLAAEESKLVPKKKKNTKKKTVVKKDKKEKKRITWSKEVKTNEEVIPESLMKPVKADITPDSEKMNEIEEISPVIEQFNSSAIVENDIMENGIIENFDSPILETPSFEPFPTDNSPSTFAPPSFGSSVSTFNPNKRMSRFMSERLGMRNVGPQ
eukprot:TRINITY_DN68090_c0_g1_i1.p1 TRINITY_DN68090_c0_g1~~TRINITY_DN68090_c0_g1_i1.p1  ORF type:complete len:281 (-),score=99.54 TRINITY_DN68090_c0_g1_i1:10-780(-)